ncbi:MAG: helix-turn-helix transcriptional regulator [Candidatus Nealsonbacteria bacterium DGGOD1a]|jgi:ribosome-binding protein aMBF1 (putative translation factor)|nr:MAG: helix-turn-helix transcriptional regulator [Candidatus Nealsonbacteria bacterium DGGOD1a]
MKTYTEFKNKLLKDEEIAKHYEKLGPEFALIEMVIKKRLKSGLSQQDLAEKIGTKQSAISRLESGRSNPSLLFLQKIAKALDSQLEVFLK